MGGVTLWLQSGDIGGPKVRGLTYDLGLHVVDGKLEIC